MTSTSRGTSPLDIVTLPFRFEVGVNLESAFQRDEAVECNARGTCAPTQASITRTPCREALKSVDITTMKPPKRQPIWGIRL
jgi:hypothetical protein